MHFGAIRNAQLFNSDAALATYLNELRPTKTIQMTKRAAALIIINALSFIFRCCVCRWKIQLNVVASGRGWGGRRKQIVCIFLCSLPHTYTQTGRSTRAANAMRFVQITNVVKSSGFYSDMLFLLRLFGNTHCFLWQLNQRKGLTFSAVRCTSLPKSRNNANCF